MQCFKPFILTKGLDPIKYPDGLTVPCGKCLGCKIKKRSEWSMRCIHELTQHEKACFLTLTYDDRHLPTDFRVHKEHLQKYFKRLRKNDKRPFKYFACGEYGDMFGRPHYHAILFGYGLSPDDYDILDINWGYGIIDGRYSRT